MAIFRKNGTSWAARRVSLGLGLASAAVLVALWGLRGRGDGLEVVETLPTIRVARADMTSAVRAPGDVDSSEKTLIECELEASVLRNGGASLRASGQSAIIELMPEGTMVKKGDVLCRLDSSEYVEMVRQQEIEVEEDRADLEGFKLDLESLEIALREYRDGQLEQLKQQAQAQIALAEADRTRQEARLEWSRRMTEIGYMTRSQLAAEEQKMQQAEITLQRNSLAHENLIKYIAPKRILTLEGQIDSARARVTYFQSRLRHNEEQLAHYQEQVELCTIRAPHDGFLIYANDDRDDTRIELGSTVRQRQDLFFLPDLSRMEIRTTLHETVVQRVEAGMPAMVRVEALPHALLEGEVISVAPLPMSKRSWRDSDDVKNFEARIQLHAIPEGLLPGMTADVEIQTAQKPATLVVPPQALAVEDGRDICYVAAGDHVERREVVLGAYHPEMIEIVDGLEEGERVVIEPDAIAETGIQVVDVPASQPDGGLASEHLTPGGGQASDPA